MQRPYGPKVDSYCLLCDGGILPRLREQRAVGSVCEPVAGGVAPHRVAPVLPAVVAPAKDGAVVGPRVAVVGCPFLQMICLASPGPHVAAGPDTSGCQHR